MAVTIKEAEDVEAAQKFLGREWQQANPGPWPTARVSLVAEREGQMIGAADGHYEAGVAHLGELMVIERERNGGVGAQLLAAFEAWAETQGAHKCTLNTDRERAAVRFYERHGWRTICVLEDHYQHHTFLMMAKSLTPRA